MDLLRTHLLVEITAPSRNKRKKPDRRQTRRERRRLAKLRGARRGKLGSVGPTKPGDISQLARDIKQTRQGHLSRLATNQPARHRSTFTKSGNLRSGRGSHKSLFARQNRDPLDPLGGPRSLFI